MKRSFLSVVVLFVCLLTCKAQAYPSSYYELSPDGKTLLFWKGDTAVVNLALDPLLSRIDSIADFAFARRDSLGNIVPDYTLEELYLPLSLRRVGYMAFWCRNLRRLRLNEGLESMDVAAVCEAPLTSLSLPSSLYQMEGSIYRCYDLEQLTVAETSPFYKIVEGVLLNEKTLSVALYPPALLRESFVLPEGCHSLAFRAFSCCQFLVHLQIPEGVERVESEALSMCLSLRSVDFPATLKSLASDALLDSTVDTLLFRSFFPPTIDGKLYTRNAKPVTMVVPDESLALYSQYKPLEGLYEVLIPLSEMGDEWQTFQGSGELSEKPFDVVNRQLVLRLPEEGSEVRIFNKEGELKARFYNSGTYALPPGVYTLLLEEKSYKFVIPAFPY